MNGLLENIYAQWGFAGLFALTGWALLVYYFRQTKNRIEKIETDTKDRIHKVETDSMARIRHTEEHYESLLSEFKSIYSREKTEWKEERGEWRLSAENREAALVEIAEKTTESLVRVAEKLKNFEFMFTTLFHKSRDG